MYICSTNDFLFMAHNYRITPARRASISHALPVFVCDDDHERTYSRTTRRANTVPVRLPVSARVERHRRGNAASSWGAAL